MSPWMALIVGFVALVAGAELLVKGASRLAAAAGVRPLVIGLTVVAFGTSAPELATSVGAALGGSADIALGNVVGSNIFNILAILGVSALITPLVVHRQLVLVDVPIMVAVSVGLFAIALDGSIGRLEGAALLAGIAIYTWLQVRMGREEPSNGADAPEAASTARRSWPAHAGLVVAGLALLVVGADQLVEGASALARAWGVSELLIGLTIVAAGTSLPEAFTSVVAAVRGERDIAVGNIVGSNIFNIFAVLGASAVIAPEGVAVAVQARDFDLPVMLAATAACLPIFFTGHRIARWEAALFVAFYTGYVGILVAGAVGYPWVTSAKAALFGWVLPLTGVTLGVLAWREWRARRRVQTS